MATKPGRVEFLLESRANLRPELFTEGTEVGFRIRQGFGVVRTMRRGHLMNESDELTYFGPPFVRDEYGVYMVEITATDGAKYCVFEHESELRIPGMVLVGGAA